MLNSDRGSGIAVAIQGRQAVRTNGVALQTILDRFAGAGDVQVILDAEHALHLGGRFPGNFLFVPGSNGPAQGYDFALDDDPDLARVELGIDLQPLADLLQDVFNRLGHR